MTTREDLGLFFAVLILVIAALIASFIYSLWVNRRKSCPSPYTGTKLRRCTDLSWTTMEQVLKFLFNRHDYDNQMFDFNRAAWCRETGRIFQNAVSFFDTIHVNWSFLEKRHPGKWISWGSLTDAQKLVVSQRHDTLKGFQTEVSSPTPTPKKIEKEYVFTVPGPLYVDLGTFTLLGWQSVPNTGLEVLIVQKPKQL